MKSTPAVKQARETLSRIGSSPSDKTEVKVKEQLQKVREGVDKIDKALKELRLITGVSK